jgi:hypothetical protein
VIKMYNVGSNEQEFLFGNSNDNKYGRSDYNSWHIVKGSVMLILVKLANSTQR